MARSSSSIVSASHLKRDRVDAITGHLPSRVITHHRVFIWSFQQAVHGPITRPMCQRVDAVLMIS